MISHLDPDAAGEWGLHSGVPVVAGASDGVLPNLGVGAVAPGVAACSIGTSGAIRGVVPEPRVDEQGRVLLRSSRVAGWSAVPPTTVGTCCAGSAG